ncbi:hypothetical protein XENTR_v10002009, partial [Xenopus tropicalis]
MSVLGQSHAESIFQPFFTHTAQQEMFLKLYCTYKSSFNRELYWFVQYPDKAPEILVSNLDKRKAKGFTAQHDSNKYSFHLIKEHADVDDSGLYFCAAG